MIRDGMIGSSGHRPDWVMIGIPLDPGLHTALWERGHRWMVAASRELRWAELKTELAMRPTYLDGDTQALPPVTETTLTARLNGYTLASGRTYGEALRAALAGWDPDHPHGYMPEQPAQLPPGEETP